jgi:hypothetical protein
MKKSIVLLALFFVANVFAAPFCVVTGTGSNCWYYDAPSCQQAAASQRGACVINQQEAQPAPRNGAPFCVVTGLGTNCWYYDAPSCQQAAGSQRGTCVVNPNR